MTSNYLKVRSHILEAMVATEIYTVEQFLGPNMIELLSFRWPRFRWALHLATKNLVLHIPPVPHSDILPSLLQIVQDNTTTSK